MQCIFFVTIFGICTVVSASISGPYLFWGHEKVVDLQPRALVEASEQDFSNLFKEAKAIVVFVRNNTSRLDGNKYTRFQKLVKANAWAYLPQHTLTTEPFDYNTNIEVINLSGNANEEDLELINGFNDALAIYGEGEVLGILANREEDAHYLSKREAARSDDDEKLHTTTMQPPLTDETDKSFIYVANGNKAILYVNSAPVLSIEPFKEPVKLEEHQKSITFDDQNAKGYGRLNIIFTVDGVKLFLRFNFTLAQGTWAMKAVEVGYKEYENVLTIVGNAYEVPSAPLGFSYRCSANEMFFKNGSEYLNITDFQVQPWLNGASKFGDVYDCVGFITSPILAGILVSFFLCGILSIGIIALMDIKTPNRFESSRSKQLTFTTQE